MTPRAVRFVHERPGLRNLASPEEVKATRSHITDFTCIYDPFESRLGMLEGKDCCFTGAAEELHNFRTMDEQ